MLYVRYIHIYTLWDAEFVNSIILCDVTSMDISLHMLIYVHVYDWG